jgi:hypothetical protein
MVRLSSFGKSWDQTRPFITCPSMTSCRNGVMRIVSYRSSVRSACPCTNLERVGIRRASGQNHFKRVIHGHEERDYIVSTAEISF